MLAVEFFAEADEEIERERRWYRERSEIAEASFLRELDHAIEVVLEAPYRWPMHVGDTHRYVFPKFPFSLIYLFENDVVFVVALVHENRRPGYWRGRLP